MTKRGAFSIVSLMPLKVGSYEAPPADHLLVQAASMHSAVVPYQPSMPIIAGSQWTCLALSEARPTFVPLGHRPG